MTWLMEDIRIIASRREELIETARAKSCRIKRAPLRIIGPLLNKLAIIYREMLAPRDRTHLRASRVIHGLLRPLNHSMFMGKFKEQNSLCYLLCEMCRIQNNRYDLPDDL
jgi:hypothetical protein